MTKINDGWNRDRGAANKKREQSKEIKKEKTKKKKEKKGSVQNSSIKKKKYIQEVSCTTDPAVLASL